QDLVNADLDGHAVGTVTLPAGTGVRTYGVRLTDGPFGEVTFRALAARKLGLDYRATVKAGARQVVTVGGLAPRGPVRVLLRGRKLAPGTAGQQGRFVVRFPVGKKVGKAKLKVLGEFSNRVGVRTFTVTRAR